MLDLDSFEKHAFDERDARELHALLIRAGLTHADPPETVTIG